MARRNEPPARPEKLSSRIVSALEVAQNMGSSIRAGRGYRKMSQKVLAERAKVSVATVNRIESDRSVRQTSLLRVIRALERDGVEFSNEGGFRGVRGSNIQI